MGLFSPKKYTLLNIRHCAKTPEGTLRKKNRGNWLEVSLSSLNQSNPALSFKQGLLSVHCMRNAEKRILTKKELWPLSF